VIEMAQSTKEQSAGERVKAGRANEVKIPRRPEPTPEQAALGILPAAIGNGTKADIDAWMRSIPHFDGTDEEFEAFQNAIAENRVMRRRLAEEKDA
jgi:hypothetical protein